MSVLTAKRSPAEEAEQPEQPEQEKAVEFPTPLERGVGGGRMLHTDTHGIFAVC